MPRWSSAVLDFVNFDRASAGFSRQLACHVTHVISMCLSIFDATAVFKFLLAQDALVIHLALFGWHVRRRQVDCLQSLGLIPIDNTMFQV